MEAYDCNKIRLVYGTPRKQSGNPLLANKIASITTRDHHTGAFVSPNWRLCGF